MTILVTGGFGYLGGRIAQHLFEQGRNVRLTSRRAKAPAWAKGMEVVGADFASDTDFNDLCLNVDAVVHLAALNAQQCDDAPELAERVNVTGTRNLFESARNAGVRRFVYVSTAHVYGTPLQGVLDENTLPHPAHVYGVSHLAAEEIVRSEGIVLRLSNAIGAPADSQANCWMLAANDLCRQAVTGNGLELRGNGLDVCDFVPVLDVCRAVNHFLGPDGETTSERIFNVGGKSMTMLALAKRIAGRAETFLGNRPNIQRKKPSPGEQELRLDYRIDRLLGSGFSPVGNIDDEINATLEFCHQTFC